MAHLDKVLRSVNQDGGAHCVDLFVRPDGSFGFELFRREPEYGRGWFAIGYYASLRFTTLEEAEIAARERIPWLPSQTA